MAIEWQRRRIAELEASLLDIKRAVDYSHQHTDDGFLVVDRLHIERIIETALIRKQGK